MPAANFLNDHYRKQARRKTRILALFCGFWLLAIVVRLVQMQVFGHARAEIRVIAQNENTTISSRGEARFMTARAGSSPSACLRDRSSICPMKPIPFPPASSPSAVWPARWA